MATNIPDSIELRERAVRLLESTGKIEALRNPGEMRQLLQELQIYQAELEIQNEELRQSQQNLIESRDRFADLYYYAPVGYVTVNFAGIIHSANLVASNLFHRTRQELEHSPLSRFISPRDTDTLYLHFKAVQKGGERQVCELELHQDCSCRYVMLDTMPTAQTCDNPAAMRVAIIDITEQRLFRQERATLDKKLQELERIESLAIIAAGVAHDFNNLLSPALTYVELLALSIGPDSPGREHLQRATQAIEKAGDVCKTMLGYAGSEQVEPDVVDPGHLIREALPLLKTYMSANTQLVIKCDDLLDPVNSSATLIDRVIMNLVVNASESITHDGGVISIQAKNVYLNSVDIEQMTIARDTSPGNHVCIEVTDNGCGMDSETLSHLFDPFFSSKASGHGLGMAAVVGLTRSHHATVKVVSQQGRGTSIGVYFPASHAPVSAVPKVSRPAITTGSATLLMVDDDKAVRTATARVLGVAGFTVVTAGSGEEALGMLRQSEVAIDVILLDYAMPGLNGFETTKKIRQFNDQVVIILQSGYAGPDIRREFDGLCVSDFIQKPCNARELTRTISTALEIAL